MIQLEPLIDICRKHRYSYNVRGDDPLFVLVGDHHRVEDLPGQEAIIEAVRPKLILHEAADAEYLGRAPQTRTVLGWEQKYSVPVKLFDMPDAERFRNGLSGAARGDYHIASEMAMPVRDAATFRLLRENVENKNLPFIAVAGTGHLAPYSHLQQFLDGAQLSYISIMQDPADLVGSMLRHFGSFFSRP